VSRPSHRQTLLLHQNYAETELFNQHRPFTGHTSQNKSRPYRAKLAQADAGRTSSVVQGQNRLGRTTVSKANYLLRGIEIWLRKFVRNF
jgi:hypothetical protein